ncbi:MAG: T9SS type A sorting domain-containing protein, partial [Bacteroidales bacterium]|nr:T9SS type A sorting domain-containing protein [Bacteroidales bacterium]
TAEVDISSFAGQVVNIRFKGETGTSYTSDMAIDNVRIEDGVEMIQSNMLLISKTEEQIEQEVSMRVYPNPSNGEFEFYLQSASSDQLIVELYNNSGQLVFRNEYQKAQGKFQKQIDIRNEMPGLYILKVVSGNDIFVERIMVSK